MKYIICELETANSNGIAVTAGHPVHDGMVCLNSTDLVLCPCLSGTFDERVSAINGKVYNSAKEVNEVIRSWNDDNNK